jgi:hypothetical protein
VKAQHKKHVRRKDTKSVKEVHAHLNLQPPRSPIASEGEESPDIESFEESLLALMTKLRCSSGMEMQALMALALTMVAWLGHPHVTLLWLTLMMMKVKEAKKKKTMSEAY